MVERGQRRIYVMRICLGTVLAICATAGIIAILRANAPAGVFTVLGAGVLAVGTAQSFYYAGDAKFKSAGTKKEQ